MPTALVVDDDHADATRAADALAAAGYSVLTASSPTEAFALHAEGGIDLVVSDVAMPGCDGPTMLKALRDGGCTASFVSMTSDPTADVRARCRDAGAAVCLPKPVDITVLVAMARQLLTNGHVVDAEEDPLDTEMMDLLRITYLKLLPERAAALSECAKRADLDALGQAAHKLAGCSAQFGYPGLAALCRSLQHSVRAGRSEPVLVEAITSAAALVQSACGASA